MKVRASKEGLAVQATVDAVYPKDTIVAISGDRTVTKALAAGAAIGRLTVPATAAGGLGTVELHARFSSFIEILAATAVPTAGNRVKLGAPDGTTGENTVSAFIEGTDSERLAVGVVWKGAVMGAVAEVLAY